MVVRCLLIQVRIHVPDCLYGRDGYWPLSWRGIYTVCLSIKEPHKNEALSLKDYSSVHQVQHLYNTLLFPSTSKNAPFSSLYLSVRSPEIYTEKATLVTNSTSWGAWSRARYVQCMGDREMGWCPYHVLYLTKRVVLGKSTQEDPHNRKYVLAVAHHPCMRGTWIHLRLNFNPI